MNTVHDGLSYLPLVHSLVGRSTAVMPLLCSYHIRMLQPMQWFVQVSLQDSTLSVLGHLVCWGTGSEPREKSLVHGFSDKYAYSLENKLMHN
jgi:hypothetical protein